MACNKIDLNDLEKSLIIRYLFCINPKLKYYSIFYPENPVILLSCLKIKKGFSEATNIEVGVFQMTIFLGKF